MPTRRDWTQRTLAGLFVIVAGSGCQTVESTKLMGAVEETGGTREVTGERQLFLEVVRPEPAWVEREKDLREKWLVTDYETDRKRSFRAFEIPETYVLSVDDFKRDPEQGTRTGPYLQLQLRERQFTTLKKEHQVQTRSMLSGPKTDKKVIPIFSQWKWEPDRVTKGGVTAWIRVEDLDDEPGLWRQVEGTLDENGQVTVGLAPWIDPRILRSRKKPMVLRLTSEAALNPVYVQITPDALFYLQQLKSGQAGTPSATDQPVHP